MTDGTFAELLCEDGVVLAHQWVVGQSSRFLRQLLLLEATSCPGGGIRQGVQSFLLNCRNFMSICILQLHQKSGD
jgi:hypothetical protein